MGQQKQKSAGPVLSVDQIMGADDLPLEAFPVPEWGGDVMIQGLSVHALNEANKKATVAGEIDAEKITVFLVIEGMVEPKLTDDQAGALALKSAAVINRIGGRVLELSGVDGKTLAGNEARFSQGEG